VGEDTNPIPEPKKITLRGKSFKQLLTDLTAALKNLAPPKESGRITSLAELIGSIRLILTSLLIFGLVILLTGIIYLEMNRSFILIESFEIPESLQERGYTPNAVANKLADQINIVTATAKTKADRYKFTPSFYETLPDVEVPEANVSIKSVVRYVKDIFGFTPTRINGEILSLDDDQLQLTVRIVESADQSKTHFRTFTGDIDEFDDVISQSAQYVLRQKDPYLLASYLYETGSTKEALLLAQYCIRHAPETDDYNANVLWGLILEERGEYEAAIEKYKQAIKKDDRTALAYIDWGLALEKKGDFQAAVEKYQKAIEVDPKAALAYNNWGNVLLAQNDDTGAIAKFEEAIRIDAEQTLPYINWAKLLAKRGDYNGAVKQYQEALAVKPNAPDIHLAWGNLLLEQGDYQGAFKEFERAVDVSPSYYLAYNDWGWALIKYRDFEQAIGKLRKAIRFAPEYKVAYMNLGYAYENLKKYPEASSAYQMAAEIEPRNVAAYNDWGYTLRLRGDFEGAISKFKKAIEIDRGYSFAHFNLAEVLERQRKYEEAIGVYKGLIQDQDDEKIVADAEASIDRLERFKTKRRGQS